jgi:hypothetical protein
MTITRFPPRRAAAIWISRERDGSAWIVLARGNGWLFGCRHQALVEATWLSLNFALPIREISA